MAERKTDIGNQDSSVIHLISDILDRLIDTQSASAQSISQMKDAVLQLTAVVNSVNHQFHNGFRSDLKSHFSAELAKSNNDTEDEFKRMLEVMKENQKSINQIYEKVRDLSDSLKKPWFWIKVVGTIIGSLGVIIGGLLKLLSV